MLRSELAIGNQLRLAILYVTVIVVVIITVMCLLSSLRQEKSHSDGLEQSDSVGSILVTQGGQSIPRVRKSAGFVHFLVSAPKEIFQEVTQILCPFTTA